MPITDEQVRAANKYLSSREATPDGIRTVKRWLELEWAGVIQQDYRPWLAELYGKYMPYDMAPHHDEFWQHIWSIQPGVRPPAWFSIWNRGGAKSTSAEMACTALGALGKRKYGIYLGGTQPSADDHVGNVGGMLESEMFARYYPQHSNPLKGKFGNSKGWRRNRIRTAGGLTIDALGLDVDPRGIKLDEQRPDFLVLDDIDALLDSPETVQKKIDTITKTLLPAGSEDLAIIGVQNLIHRNGIFTRITDGRADFLRNRIVSGPIPALHDFGYEVRDNKYIITSGAPTWVGFDLKRCEELLNDIGPKAFATECQHAVYEVEGALWRQGWIDDHRETRLNYIGLSPIRTVVGVDPAVTDNPDSDETGIIVACKSAHDRHDYVVADRSCRVSPLEWAKRVVQAYKDFQADAVVVETNQGGDLVKENIWALDRHIPIIGVHAKRGKELRAQPVANLYEQGKVHHMSTFMYPADNLGELEAQMLSWVPGQGASPDRVDAACYGLSELSIGGGMEMETEHYVQTGRRGR